jgi:hypothetical protein
MIGVRMSQEYILNAFLLLRSSMETQASGVDRHTAVDQVTRNVLAFGGVFGR